MPYVPAILPDGDVPLRLARAFIGLAQEVTQQKLLAVLDEAREASPDVSADTSGPRPITVAEQIGAESDAAPLSGFELFDAVVYGEDSEGRPWAPRFASVMVWRVDETAPETGDSPAGYRAVTEAEASGISFPTRAFSEAWSPFFSASTGLTPVLLGTQPVTASTSAEATTTTTPA